MQQTSNTDATLHSMAYNPASNCFEALAVFHTENGDVRVAASLNAPVATDPEIACVGLLADARRAKAAPTALRSRQQQLAPSLRSPRKADNPRSRSPFPGVFRWAS
jgi:hypothetical protein